jgi:pyruvate carboxylase subunit B
MIFAEKPKKIRVMFTPFRDGLQSSFGGKVRLQDFLPAMELSAECGIRHFEFGGGARFQAPLFYLGENPFEDMRVIRDTVGKDLDYQILTRSVSGVTLTTQSPEGLALQGKLMAAAGTTWDRNFDYMNDVDNMIATGKPIVDAGMHHQACIALMGLPFHSDSVHTAEFYIDIGKRLLEGDVQIDSICLKDASGTTDPATIYNTAVGLRKLMPPEMPLWMHTHDTASTAVACYMAAIHGGCDGVDVSVRPMASGTVQPDARSVAHALKGTGYSLDIDVSRMGEIEGMLTEDMKDYAFNPTTTTADARVLGFPMPGGAIGPNVHMMVKAGILERYGDVLEEFPVVVEAGGAWTSVTPGSQQYWLQAFNNVMYGRWEKIEAGYGKAVLGYFGRTPLKPDPEVVKIAAQQLGMDPFDGDPLAAAPVNVEPAKKALQDAGLPVTDENTFLVMACIVPGKKIELNEGLRLLRGEGKIDIPLKKKEEAAQTAVAVTAPAAAETGRITGPVTTKVLVRESGKTRNFTVTVEPVSGGGAAAPTAAPVVSAADAAAEAAAGEAVFSTFAGKVEIVDILVNVGDKVAKGSVIAQIEAMKATHDIKTPKAGTIAAVHVRIGDEIDSTVPVVTVA